MSVKLENNSNEQYYPLLSEVQKEKQAMDLDGMTIYLSVEDNLVIGEGSEFGDDYNELALYTEQLTVNKKFKLKNGILSTHHLFSDGIVKFDLQGKSGTTPTDKIDGTNGENGGNLNLFIGVAADNQNNIHINASGGNGGRGKSGTFSTDGGNGGDGGDGGNINIISIHPFLEIISNLVKIYRCEDIDKKIIDISSLIKLNPTNEFLKPLSDAIQGDYEIDSLNNLIQEICITLNLQVEILKNTLQTQIDVTGGSYGTYGQGKINGENGANGSSNIPNITLASDHNQFSKISEEQFFPWIHPRQSQMLLEKAKLNYFYLDPLDQDSVSETMIYFNRLHQRTALFNDVKTGDELDSIWSKYESQIGAKGSIKIFKDIYTSSTLYLNRLAKGYDYYGYPHNYVPVISFEFSRTQLNTLVTNFKTIENEYRKQLASMKDIEQTKSALACARSQAEMTYKRNEQKIENLISMMENTSRLIIGYSHEIEQKQKLVDQKITKFKHDIEMYFDWNWDNLFSSLGSLAFAPESYVMWITQASKLTFDGITKITDNYGNQINKDYLISHITTVKSDIASLKEGYITLPDGTINPDDPGASKIIGDISAIEALINQISERLDEEDVKDVFKDYIKTVVDRNSQILSYNAMAILLVQTTNDLTNLENDIKQYNQEMINNITETSLDYTEFVSQMYLSTLSQLFEMLYLTTRAYNFWALDNKSLVGMLGGNPNKITYADLVNSQNQIIDKYKDAVINFGTSCNYFPEDKNNKGISYQLNKLQVNFLKENFETMVKIPVVDKSTKWTHPFCGLSNIRVTKVRCYLKGAKLKPGARNNEIQINITHTGLEQITSRDNKVYTFNHDKREVPFRYDIDSNSIKIDGDFGVHYHDEKTPYALYGPFTTWKIEIDSAYREIVDLTELSEVTLEFNGTCYSFNT